MKNLHNLLEELKAKHGKAISSDSNGIETALCDKAGHGQYPLNEIDFDGRKRWFAGGCQKCQADRSARALFDKCNIPKRFEQCTFENYITSTPEQRKVLDRCISYASDFDRTMDLGTCLLLCGNPGTGKNHLATAIMKNVGASGKTALRVKASQYLDAYWSKGFGEREAWLDGLADVDLIMIDEIGRSSDKKAAQDAFFRLIDMRYEKQKPSLLTTNLNREDLIQTLGEAAYDRLTQGGSVRLTLEWTSHRREA